MNQFIHSSVSPSLLGDYFSYPLEVGRVALVNRQADDLGHLIRMVGAAEDNYESTRRSDRHSTYKQE